KVFTARSPLPPVLVAWSESWHKGVVGVAAGRVAKDLHRPTVLLAVEGETATGSGRRVPGIELHGFLPAWKERVERFGGAAQAGRPRPGGGIDGEDGAAGGAAAGVGGGGHGLAGGSPGAADRVRAPPAAGRGVARSPGASGGPGAVRPGELPSGFAYGTAARRGGAPRLRQRPPLGTGPGGGRRGGEFRRMAMGGTRGEPARPLRGPCLRRGRFVPRRSGAATGRQPARYFRDQPLENIHATQGPLSARRLPQAAARDPRA